VAKSTLLELEKGRTEARLNTIAALAGSFDKSISELFKGL
jgi:DNA-binding XRE family transcriptional regulator